MNSKDIKNLYEAYSAVYDEELRNELEEMTDEFAGIEELTEEEIDAIVENTIFEMIAEGYEFDEVEEIFEEVLSEGRVDMAARAAARREYARSSEKAASQARRAGASVVRREKRAEKIAQVKGAVKSTLSRAKEAAKSGVAKAKEAGREAKFQAVDKPVAAYATKRGLHPGAGLAARSKDPEKRRGLRAKVASDIKSRIGGKIRGAVEKARTLGAGAASAAASAPEAARQAGSDVKSSVKGRIGRAALGVAKRMGVAEEVDLYDIVLEHLLDEGFAETEEAATVIMANMSEEWRQEILDEAADNVIMTVKSPSGQERSKIFKGASRPSDSHRHENPEQIANRRFSQQLADRKKEREERMRAGRLTVATKRGIEAATNRSNDGVGGNRFVQGSSLRARERDDQPTDYRARRRRASGR